MCDAHIPVPRHPREEAHHHSNEWVRQCFQEFEVAMAAILRIAFRIQGTKKKSS